MRRWLPAAVLMMIVPFAGAELLAPAQWLVDLGRDYPLSPQASVSDADAELTLLFMEAAARLDPKLADAYLWQYDMLAALGREGEARRALEQYVSLRPHDDVARFKWIQLTIESLQTAEARAQYCRLTLEKSDLAPEIASDMHRRLAEFHWNRAEQEKAEQEAIAALKAFPWNVAAQVVLDHLRGEAERPLARIRRLTMELAIDPANTPAAQALGDELRFAGMPAEATTWYEHAIAIASLLPPGTPPAPLQMLLAEARLDAGSLDEAARLAADAIKELPDEPEAHVLAATIWNAVGDRPRADESLQQAERLYKREIARGKPLAPDAAGRIAWFIVHERARPAEAEALARTAPESPIALRALGAALRLQGKLDEAKQVLEPVAETDNWARIELAQTLQAAGDAEGARKVLAEALAAPLGGEQRRTAMGLAGAWGVTAARSQPAAEDIRSVLQAFPKEVLDFPLHPERYLSVSMTPSAEEYGPSVPWPVKFQIRNTGTFAISLGAGGMVMPEVLCAVATHGDRERSSGPTLRISLNRRLRLNPGEGIETNQTLSIGTVRSSMVGTPQVTHDVEVSGVLSPLRLMTESGQEVWVPAPGGLLLTPAKFRRAAFIATRENFEALLAESRGSDSDARARAMQILAMLIGEQQHLAAVRLSYAARRIDASVAESAVLARASDPDWQVRARLAEALRWFVLDATATQTATQMLGDGHWLVRGLVARALADQHGTKFRAVLDRLSSADPDVWVRRWCAALLSRFDNAATRPAESPRPVSEMAPPQPGNSAPEPLALPE